MHTNYTSKKGNDNSLKKARKFYQFNKNLFYFVRSLERKSYIARLTYKSV